MTTLNDTGAFYISSHCDHLRVSSQCFHPKPHTNTNLWFSSYLVHPKSHYKPVSFQPLWPPWNQWIPGRWGGRLARLWRRIPALQPSYARHRTSPGGGGAQWADLGGLAFSSRSFNCFSAQTVRARKLKFWENVHPHHMSHILCHMSHVACGMSCVTFFFFYKIM